MATRVRISVIPSVEESLCNLGTFAFVALHLLSTGGNHLPTVAELLRLIESLEGLHTHV